VTKTEVEMIGYSAAGWQIFCDNRTERVVLAINLEAARDAFAQGLGTRREVYEEFFGPITSKPTPPITDTRGRRG
jgi:hypothetical protein